MIHSHHSQLLKASESDVVCATPFLAGGEQLTGCTTVLPRALVAVLHQQTRNAWITKTSTALFSSPINAWIILKATFYRVNKSDGRYPLTFGKNKNMCLTLCIPFEQSDSKHFTTIPLYFLPDEQSVWPVRKRKLSKLWCLETPLITWLGLRWLQSTRI